MNYALEMEPIDGSPVVGMDGTGLVTCEDGRQWYWHDTSYRTSETGWNLVPDGEWIEYKHNRL